MSSEIGRMLKCLKNKQSYHSLQDDAYSHITLLQTEENSSQQTPTNDEINSSTSSQTTSNSNEQLASPKDNKPIKSGIVKNRSLDSLIEEIGDDTTVNQNCQVDRSSQTVSPNQQRSVFNASEVGESSSSIIGKAVATNGHQSGGRLRNFFGKKFNKSSTRHLDRSSGDVDKNEPCNPNRYTKFPLRSSAVSHVPEVFEANQITTTSDPTSSSVKPRVESQTPSSSEASTAPQSNSRFDISQIQSTPQTKVYSNPHRSPSRSSTRKGTFSPCNFISKSINSFGKKSSKSSARKGNSSIDRTRSQSDNNLNRNRVNVNSVSGNSALSAILGAGRCVTSSFQNIYNSEPGHEYRNSVQTGDHATIILPWTGLQRNNLSTPTSHRVHQNTHNNNLDGVRYVECGFTWTRDDTRSSASGPESTEYSTCSARRRSKSLERDLRINPRNSISSCSAGTLNSSHSSTSSDTYKSKRGTDFSPKLNVCQSKHGRHLTPDQQEVLLRNIRWESGSVEGDSESAPPPPRPDKHPSLRHKLDCAPSSSSSFSTTKHSVGLLSPASKKPPLIGAINRSVPNSFSDSSDSINNHSAPPSPPPRPPSSLKPESSRLLNPVSRSSLSKKTSNVGVVRSRSFKAPSNTCHIEPRNSKSDVEDVVALHTSGHILLPSTEDNGLQTSAATTQSKQSLSPASASGSSKSVPKMSVEEVARNSGFINKPSKGWLHPDKLLSKEGVSYNVRYIGCLDVNTSMKSLDFDSRSLIAKECINQVCEAAGLKSVDRKRKVDRNMMRILGARPRLDNAGSDVKLTITSTCLKLTSLDTGAVVSSHEMPNISFASGGDATMLDFIAYVAKDSVVGRACFILECGSGLAQDVIITIGQAFELRFKEYIQKRPPPPRLPADDREYYNDLPGKQPPENTKDGKTNGNHDAKSVAGKGIPTLTLPVSSEVSVNLIDFEAPTPPAFGPTTQERHLESLLLGPDSPPFATVSSATSSGTGLGLPNSPSQPKPQGSEDLFDMKPFAADLPKPLSEAEQRKQLETQNWFHGCISRSQSEKLVKNDGDFLVRESQTAPGQYVLTGLQDNHPKHLLLVDTCGIVRTKDQTFDNVIHLIRHHSDNCRPIISAESMVILKHPVLRDTHPDTS